MKKMMMLVGFVFSFTAGPSLTMSSALGATGAPSKATTCIACHGPAGISNGPLWPNLAGQKKDYLQKQLHAFRDGSRKDPMMSPTTQGLTDTDIVEIATYYSNLK